MIAGIIDRMRALLNRAEKTRTGPAILLYHRVAEERFDPWSLAVSPQHFAEQMDWLGRHRTVLPLTEFARRHRERPLPPNVVAITFDDGYACNAHVAAPILQRVGLPATIFLPAEIIERGDRFWWDELQTIVIDHPASEATLDGETIALGPKQNADAQWAPRSPPRTERQRAFLTIWSRLRTKSSDALAASLKELRGERISETGEALKRPMALDEVRSVPPEIEFGSHALTHRSLPALDATDKAREISDSVRRCEALTGYRPRSFAYPFGDADAECIRLVEDAGFECACITAERTVMPDSEVYALPRIGVGNVDAEGFAQLLGQA